jgi:hypothetical protein
LAIKWVRKRVLHLAIVVCGMGAFAWAGAAVGQTTGFVDDTSLTVRVSPSATERGAAAMREVADRIDAAGVQLSTLSGAGGPAAARDLLFRPGVEFAVLRSDLLAYLRQSGELPEAAARLRYVTHLYTDKLYLWARAGVARVAGLEGRTLAVVMGDKDARVTAETLLGLAKVQAELVEFEPSPVAGRGGGPVQSLPDAVLLIGAQMQPSLVQWARSNGYALVGIEMTSDLARAFVSVEMRPDPSAAASLPTLGVAAFLATFDWNTQGERFSKVRRFLTSFFRSLTDLRAAHPQSVWPETDLALQPGEWRRFGPARPNLFIKPTERRLLRSVRAPRSYLDLETPDPPSPVAEHMEPRDDEAVRAARSAPRPTRAAPTLASKVPVAVVRRPPFADENSDGDNVVLEILRASWRAATSGDQPQADLVVSWTERGALMEPEGSPFATAVISLPWQRPRCDSPGDLTRAAALLCDQAILSKPIMRVVAGVYVDAARRAKLDAARKGGAQSVEVGVCVPSDAETASAPKQPTSAASGAQLEFRIIKRRTMVHCIAAVQTGDADGFLATDLEARQFMSRLGLSGTFEIYEPTLFTDSLHVAAPRGSAEGAAVIARIDAGLARLKDNGAYAKLMERYVVAAWKANR